MNAERMEVCALCFASTAFRHVSEWTAFEVFLLGQAYESRLVEACPEMSSKDPASRACEAHGDVIGEAMDALLAKLKAAQPVRRIH